MRQILRRCIPIVTVVSLQLTTAATPGLGPVLRPKQGPIQGLRVRGPQDRPFRRLLLRRRARIGRARRPHGRTLVRAPRRTSSSHQMQTRQPLILYASHPDFEQTNVVGGMIGEGTGGVTEGLKRRVVLPLAGSLQETDHVLGPRAGSCIPIRHLGAARQGGARSAASRACRSGSSKGWPNTCRLGRRSAHRHVAARRPARQASSRRFASSTPGGTFPTDGARPCGRMSAGSTATSDCRRIYREAVRSGSPLLALKTATGLDEKVLSANWHADIRRSTRR